MDIAFANSGFVPAPEAFVQRGGAWRWRPLRVRFGVLRHPQQGVWLIDTGIGPEVTEAPGRSLALSAYACALRYRLSPSQSPEAVLGQMGLTCADVAGVIVTHFHADHVAGLRAFPQARILAHGPSLAAVRASSLWGNLRHGIFAELIPQGLEARLTCVTTARRVGLPYGLGDGWDIFGDGSCLAVDLPGHAAGHFGLAFPQRVQPLLYAVDAAWVLPALGAARAPGFPLRAVLADVPAAQDSMARAARWRALGGQVLLCHDPVPSAYDLPA